MALLVSPVNTGCHAGTGMARQERVTVSATHRLPVSAARRLPVSHDTATDEAAVAAAASIPSAHPRPQAASAAVGHHGLGSPPGL